jgi:hypothetical protein
LSVLEWGNGIKSDDEDDEPKEINVETYLEAPKGKNSTPTSTPTAPSTTISVRSKRARDEVQVEESASKTERSRRWRTLQNAKKQGDDEESGSGSEDSKNDDPDYR